MNPLNELNARFWRAHQQDQALGETECLVYLYLVTDWQAKRWATPFELSDATAIAGTRLSRNAFKPAREKLVAAGLFTYETRRGRGNACRYEFPPFRSAVTLTAGESILTDTPEIVSSADTINPLKLSANDTIESLNVSFADSLDRNKLSANDSLPKITRSIVSGNDSFRPEIVSGNDTLDKPKVSGNDTLPRQFLDPIAKELAELDDVNALLSAYEKAIVPVYATQAQMRERESIILIPEKLSNNTSYPARATHESAHPPGHPHPPASPPDDGQPRVFVTAESVGLTGAELYDYLKGPRGNSRRSVASYVEHNAGKTFTEKAELHNAVRTWLKAQKAAQSIFPPGLDLEARKAHFIAKVRTYQAENPGLYDDEMYDDFITYYTEHTEGAKKMRIDDETHWDYATRLSRSNKMVYLPKKAREARMGKTSSYGQTASNNTSNTKSPVHFNLETALQNQANSGGTIGSWGTGIEDD